MTNIIIPQSNQKIKENRCISALGRGRIEHLVAREILLDSNELATDILVTNEFTALEPDGFAKYENVWAFYSVTETYLKGVMQRNWISSQSTPEDVHRERGTENITISARMVLALSAIMYQGRNIPADSKVMQVYKNLYGTRYYSRAEKRLNAIQESITENAKKRSAALSFVESALTDNTDDIEVAQNGRVLISVASLAKLVQFMTDTQGNREEPKSQQGEARHTSHSHAFHCKKVMLISKDGEKKEFDSIKKCAEYLGVHRTAVGSVCGKENRTVHGYSVIPAQ